LLIRSLSNTGAKFIGCAGSTGKSHPRLIFVPQDDPDFNDNVHLYDYGYVDSSDRLQLKSYLSRSSCEVQPVRPDTIPLNTVEQMAALLLNVRKEKSKIMRK